MGGLEKRVCSLLRQSGSRRMPVRGGYHCGAIVSDCAPNLVRKPRLLYLDRDIIFSPAFLPQKKVRRNHVIYDVAWNNVRAHKDSSIYFSYLFQALFGGRVTKTYKTDIDHTLNGHRMNFHPDLVKHTQYGPVYTEVKGKFINSGFYNCGVRQLQNYIYKLMTSESSLPCMNYAFFIYGTGNTANLGEGGIDGLVGKVARTRELLILPTNVMLLAMMLSPKMTHNQFSSDSNIDEQWYFHLSSGVVSQFRDMDGKGFGGLMDDSRKDACAARQVKKPSDRSYLIEALGLPLTRKECLMSVDVGEFKCAYDGNHGPAIARVNPFLITRYTMSRDAYAEWLPAFRKSHSRILHDYLKIKDLCCDDPVPF